MNWNEYKLFIIVCAAAVLMMFAVPSLMSTAAASSKVTHEQIVEWVESTGTTAVSTHVMIKIAEIESSFRPRAKSFTGCKGLYQFCSKTWRRVVRQYGARDGVKLSDIYNPRANTVMAVRLAEMNSEEFHERMGRYPQHYEIYMMHNIGIDGTIALLEADPDDTVSQYLIGSNPRHNPKYLTNRGKPISVGQALRNYYKEFVHIPVLDELGRVRDSGEGLL